MRKPVTYHGIAFEHEGNSEQGGAESHKDTRYNRAAHKGI